MKKLLAVAGIVLVGSVLSSSGASAAVPARKVVGPAIRTCPPDTHDVGRICLPTAVPARKDVGSGPKIIVDPAVAARKDVGVVAKCHVDAQGGKSICVGGDPAIAARKVVGNGLGQMHAVAERNVVGTDALPTSSRAIDLNQPW